MNKEKVVRDLLRCLTYCEDMTVGSYISILKEGFNQLDTKEQVQEDVDRYNELKEIVKTMLG